jgi:hypothetical protein
MRRGILVAALGGAVVLCVASPASAAPGYCVAHVEKDDYLTPVFEFPPSSDSLDSLFSDFTENEVGRAPWKVDCWQFDSEAEANDMRARHMRDMPAGIESAVTIEGFAESLSEQPKTAAGSKPSPKTAGPKPKAVSAEATPAEAGPTAAEIAAKEHRAVEERNRAAHEKYEAALAQQKRQVEEYEQAKEEVGRKKAEQEAAARQAMDASKGEQENYAEQVRRHQQEVIDYQGKVLGAASANKLSTEASRSNGNGAGKGGIFQATSGLTDTREKALWFLNQQPGAKNGLTDVQCQEITFYTPSKWTCWGFYRQEVKPTAASAQ